LRIPVCLGGLVFFFYAQPSVIASLYRTCFGKAIPDLKVNPAMVLPVWVCFVPRNDVVELADEEILQIPLYYPQLMRILFLLGRVDALAVDLIDLYFARGMDDHFVVEHDAYVGDAAFVVVKKS